MKHVLSVIALAATGAFVAPASAFAVQADESPSADWRDAAVMEPAVNLGTASDQRDVIEPPSSIDPGMALDPPQTGARMPIIRPPGAIRHGLVLPR